MEFESPRDTGSILTDRVITKYLVICVSAVGAAGECHLLRVAVPSYPAALQPGGAHGL